MVQHFDKMILKFDNEDGNEDGDDDDDDVIIDDKMTLKMTLKRATRRVFKMLTTTYYADANSRRPNPPT